MANIYISSNEFLEDVKFKIKELFHNQQNYADKIGYSRKALNRILNSGDEITLSMVNNLCNDLNLSITDYLIKG